MKGCNLDKDTIILILLIACFILHLLPRVYVRQIRKWMATFIYWQWKKMSRLSAIAYSWLYDRINGNNDADL